MNKEIRSVLDESTFFLDRYSLLQEILLDCDERNRLKCASSPICVPSKLQHFKESEHIGD